MAIFHHSFTDVEKLFDSLPFEPDNFPSITRPRITPYTGEQRQKKGYSLRSLNDQMPDAGRQIYKIRVPKDVELTPLENKNEQEQNKMVKKELREMENQRKK